MAHTVVAPGQGFLVLCWSTSLSQYMVDYDAHFVELRNQLEGRRAWSPNIFFKGIVTSNQSLGARRDLLKSLPFPSSSKDWS